MITIRFLLLCAGAGAGLLCGPSAHADKKPAADRALTVSAAARAKASLYGDGKSHFVALIPDDEGKDLRLYYGGADRLYRVPALRALGPFDFEDPRFFVRTSNADFRGVDYRVISAVERDKDEKTLDVRCGDRHATFTRVEDAVAQAQLSKAAFEKTLRKWRPYALARDNNGKYYYVDRGFDEDNLDGPKNFRLFVGQRGQLKLQKMTNVVSDSEGDIFSTKSGDLRLVLNRSESEWVQDGKSRKLLWVSPWQNLNMIYTELGVYSGERLGTPCDDL